MEATDPFSEGHASFPELLPARMVNEYVYCPRLSYLMWVQGEWAASSDTVEGTNAHRRVDPHLARVFQNSWGGSCACERIGRDDLWVM